MAKYRKKPVVIEAFLWTGGPDQQEDPIWMKDAIQQGTVYFQGGNEPHLTFETLEGPMRVSRGDYIIKGVKGELYPCKPDIFAATYEPAEESPFRPVAIGEVNYLYAAGEMGFTCPCGATVAIDDEPVTCTCGRLYRVRHYLEVKEKE